MGFDHICEKTDYLLLLHRHAFLQNNTKRFCIIILLAAVILNMYAVDFKEAGNVQMSLKKPNAP
jgi:hypothetical protein